MKAKLLLGIFFLTTSISSFAQRSEKEKKIDKNVSSLLSRMTLDEKIEQMLQDAPYNKRLGIPQMIYSECLHGLWLEGATVFPQAIALGSTWDPTLIQKMTGYIAKEARGIGVTHCYSPNLDVANGDPRYGRIEESYGEDPYLVSRMGVAFIKGLQGEGDELFDKNHIIATAKHFVAYPENRRGINGGFTDISERRIREIFLPPFIAAINEAKVGSLMPAHQDMNGIPCHMNQWLLNDLLRKEMKFDGFIISDNTDIGRLRTMHYVARNKKEAAVYGLKAGVDMELVIGKNPNDCSYISAVLKDTIQKDKSLMKYVDLNVGRILKAKYRLGLFDEPQQIAANQVIKSTKEAQDWAYKVAQKAIILLKNDNKALPLVRRNIKSVAVIGPNAFKQMGPNKRYVQLGSYAGNPPYYTSIYEGIKNKLGNSVKVNYAEGCDFWGSSYAGFPKAIQTAQDADVIVLALGGSTLTCGEGVDRDDLNLTGLQMNLVDSVCKLGKPVVAVLLNGRPLTIEPLVKKVDALIEGWYLGMRTGDAVADVLFGDYNPGGKLTVTFPKNIGQIPATYLLKPDFVGSGKGQYKNSDKTPLFPFGYGLSYTTFKYDNIALSQKSIKAGESVKLSFNLTNTGLYDGDEIVQVYVRDNYATVGHYDKLLKRFERVSLKKGETKKVEIELGADCFDLLDASLKRVIEPGDFTVYVGKSSRKEDLQPLNLSVK